MKKKFMRIAAAGIMTLGVADQVMADNSSSDPIVKCYGIAKAGENDCATPKGTHGCAGQATVNYDPCEWKAVKRSECLQGVVDHGKTIVGSEKPVNCKSDHDPDDEADTASEKESTAADSSAAKSSDNSDSESSDN